MTSAPHPLRETAFFRTLGVVAVGHALIVFVLWLEETYSKFALLSGTVWLAIAWAWLIWPIALAIHPAGSRRRVAIPVLLGMILLAPCSGSIFLFTSWALENLARTD
jgi:hypothetical protein